MEHLLIFVWRFFTKRRDISHCLKPYRLFSLFPQYQELFWQVSGHHLKIWCFQFVIQIFFRKLAPYRIFWSFECTGDFTRVLPLCSMPLKTSELCQITLSLTYCVFPPLFLLNGTALHLNTELWSNRLLNDFCTKAVVSNVSLSDDLISEVWTCTCFNCTDLDLDSAWKISLA